MKNLGVDFTFTLQVIFYRGKKSFFHISLCSKYNFKVSLKSEFFELNNFSRKFRPRGKIMTDEDSPSISFTHSQGE